MNHISLIALCLGIIAVLLSIHYMNFGEKLYTELKNIKTKCITVNKYSKKEKEIIYSILELQKNTGLDINKLKNLIIKYSKTISKNDNSQPIIESFENPKNIKVPNEVYSNSENRGFDNFDIFNQALYNI